MKRPKINSKKISWFSIASVFLLAVALAVGVTTSAQAATGSFDRDGYLPDLGSSDFDRAWISVTDSAGNTTSSPDTVTVTVKAGSVSTSFVLKETGNTSTVFSTTGSTQSVTYPVGTTSGYVEDFNTGSHNYPALGTTVVGLNLKELTANTGGDATTGSDASLTVSSGTTLELLYGGSTLDTAVVKTNSGSFSFTPSAVSAVTTNSSVSGNLIVSITDIDENLNPVAKDVIGFADNSARLSGTPGTGSSRVQIEAIDQTTGSRLTLGSTPIVARNIMLVETGNNTGVFSASGKVFGTSTTVASTDLVGNLNVGTGSTPVYTGGDITLGSLATGPGVTFKILEVTGSGRLALVEIGTTTTGATAQQALVYVSPSADVTSTWSNGSQSATLSNVAAIGTTSVIFGGSLSTGRGTSSTGLIKLIEGSDYCLVAISAFQGTTTPNLALGGEYEVGNGGSVTVTYGSFVLAGPRSGDTLKMSYLDELNAGGTSGTVTGTLAYGVSGETGTLAQSNAAPDINDLLTITVVDGNLNTSSSSNETVGADTSLWGGTTTNNRGDRLTVKNYSTSNTNISLSHPDGFAVGTQTVRIASTDNTYVWMVPNSLTGTFQSPLSSGSTTFALGTQSVSTVPLVRGSSSGATSFLSSASTSSFVATLDGLDNTVEISPDGTRWISVPIVETGANSSTFMGTIGFDYTAARLTTDTSLSVTSVISDYTGTSTLIFDSTSGYTTNNRLDSFIGTGSVVRIFDGSVQEFAEVTSPGPTSLSVTKLSNSTAFTPKNMWVQVIGNDMVTQRLDTNSAGTEYFRIGGYYGATYRLRYNDAVGASGVYLGGDTLAITTTNMGFTTYTGSLSTDITGTSGPDTYVVVTLVDQDLNTSTGSKQTTFEANSTNSGTRDIIFLNENGLGLPSGSSTGNVSRGFKNGGTAKILYASTLSSILSSSVDQANGGNTIDFKLVETDNNTGTFKGSFQLSSATATVNTNDASILKVSNGSNVYVYYNDSPNATAADNSSSYTATSPIAIVTSLGTLSLSKDTAYLSGDTVVATVVDVDRNSSLTTADTLTTALKVTGSNYSVGTDLQINLVENGVNTGTFLATITTGTTTSTGGTTVNSGTIKTVQGGIANVIYTDTSPSASSATKTLSFSSSDATLAFDADSYSLDTYALVTLVDAERNTSISTAQSLLSDVFIQTSSANSTKVRMVETAADTGTFKGSIQVASSGDTTEFSKIKAAAGDTVKINYIDEVNTTGSSRTVTDTATVAAVAATPTPTPTATPVTSPTATPTATPVTTSTPPTTGTIQVTVVSSALGQPPVPIDGATVSVDTAPAGTTGPDGSLVIPDVAAGDHTVDVTATGFDSSSQPVTVPAGGVATVIFDLVPSGVVTPTPTVTPTPVCEPEAISVSPTSLTLKRNKSGDVTVTVTGADDCAVEGETVTATINSAGKKRISVSPTSDSTDENGQVTFTITAKKKTGSARVTFKAGSVKKSMTVKVRK
ncbi:MAG: carboxypeptidase regulatory-like domain-containing protein [Planctomycetes bacterium]|uniref:Kustd1514 family S-layer glycoprotein n=1 Tax=Candidatus Wunengus sp. YC65 TaxID=3367701 RepID=UPI001D4EDDA6|nr:carboxypeptidase regulatory-like domain-containing protein [Planctomycetota bacterium]